MKTRTPIFGNILCSHSCCIFEGGSFVSNTSMPAIMLTYRPLIHLRGSTYWPEYFLHFTPSKYRPVDLSLITGGRYFDQNVDLLTCHPFHKVDTLTSMFPTCHCLTMSNCHTSQTVGTLTRMFPTRYCLKISNFRPVTHPRRSTR